ncbi:MAG: HD domain-containing protein [Candidatus Micrarchaeota archaeon]|nr:HD domain-containing protein [Candidatus Micrarchaeota archaeon]
MAELKRIRCNSAEGKAELMVELMRLGRGSSGAADHSFKAGSTRLRMDVDGLQPCTQILGYLPTTLSYRVDHRTAPNELLGAFSCTSTITSTGLWLPDAVFIMERLVDFSTHDKGRLKMVIEASGSDKTMIISFDSECRNVEGRTKSGAPYSWVPSTLVVSEEENPPMDRGLIPIQFMSGTDPDYALDVNIFRLTQPDGFLTLVINEFSKMERYSNSQVLHRQSVMEHTGSVSLIAMVISDILDDNNIKHDREKVLRLAITHELNEMILGEIPLNAKRGMSKEQIEALRRTARDGMPQLLASLKDTRLYRSYRELFEEEEARESMEYLILKAADIVDTFIFYRREVASGNREIHDIEMDNRQDFEDVLERIFRMHDAKLKYGPGLMVDAIRTEDIDWGPLA